MNRPQLILDAGGVLVTNLTPAYWQELADAAFLTYEEIRTAYRADIRGRLWTGELTEGEFWDWLQARCPGVEIRLAKELLNQHLSPLPGYHCLPRWSELADIHILSNHRAEWLLPLLEDAKPYLRSITISSDAGMSKPDEGIFALANTQVIQEAPIMFVDDSGNNLEAAGRLGWKTLLADSGGAWIQHVNAWLEKEKTDMNDIVLKDAAIKDPDLLGLIDKLDTYLYEIYPPEEVFVVDLDDPDLAAIHFVVAYADGSPVGCGAIKEIDEASTELKRFYVDPAYRNRGIAGRILRYLEGKAAEKQYTYIRLETGDPQFEAIQFYKKNGYYAIAPYGEYVDCPSSVCFEKKLG
ncbi:GNAT family N-acetyltransferase [Paenibacillus sp. R14(2021)]|uniref:GNAT family N-acetyltransferase n=1 Tax=Paenibacillus sp. R14(2021) TaxID=2859228 RepID=UPI001C612EB9|nr:GNAT family N-acetyltransferase [Paenibacillus sp. R14(2021)]